MTLFGFEVIKIPALQIESIMKMVHFQNDTVCYAIEWGLSVNSGNSVKCQINDRKIFLLRHEPGIVLCPLLTMVG